MKAARRAVYNNNAQGHPVTGTAWAPSCGSVLAAHPAMIEGQMQLRYDAQMSQILDGIHVVSKKNKVRRRRDPERRQAGYVPALMRAGAPAR